MGLRFGSGDFSTRSLFEMRGWNRRSFSVSNCTFVSRASSAQWGISLLALICTNLTCSELKPRACGDGVVTAFEECDGTNLPQGSTCSDMRTPITACTSLCRLDRSTCPAPSTCRNPPGVIDQAEECDDTNVGGKTCASLLGDPASGTLKCRPNCTFDAALCTAGGAAGGSGGSGGSGAAVGRFGTGKFGESVFGP